VATSATATVAVNAWLHRGHRRKLAQYARGSISPTIGDSRLRLKDMKIVPFCDGEPPGPEGQVRREREFVLTAVEAPMAENELLTPAEVAAMFRVDPKTVTRWAQAGKLAAVRTLGGHRRFRADDVRRSLEEI
jgi:excisionase family DNA binding protein